MVSTSKQPLKIPNGSVSKLKSAKMIGCKCKNVANQIFSCFPSAFKQSGEIKNASVSGNLALDGSGNGLSVKGNADESIAAKAGLQAGEGKKMFIKFIFGFRTSNTYLVSRFNIVPYCSRG